MKKLSLKQRLKNVAFFVLDRFKEPSTWRGIILLATSCGVYFSPELTEGIITIGLAAAGAVGVFTEDDRKSKQKKEELLLEESDK